MCVSVIKWAAWSKLFVCWLYWLAYSLLHRTLKSRKSLRQFCISSDATSYILYSILECLCCYIYCPYMALFDWYFAQKMKGTKINLSLICWGRFDLRLLSVWEVYKTDNGMRACTMLVLVLNVYLSLLSLFFCLTLYALMMLYLMESSVWCQMILRCYLDMCVHSASGVCIKPLLRNNQYCYNTVDTKYARSIHVSIFARGVGAGEL